MMLLTLALVAVGAPVIASAQYFSGTYVEEKIGANTLEEVLMIKRNQVNTAWPAPHYDGPIPEPPLHRAVVITVASLLGGIATIFFISGRSGKYAATESG